MLPAWRRVVRNVADSAHRSTWEEQVAAHELLQYLDESTAR